jgi:glycosyltransferase involved in cell wall biosynthesis
MSEVLYIVIPCYNEQEVLPETARRLKEKLIKLRGLGKIHEDSRIMFVNDGSKDATWPLIQSLCAAESVYAGVNLSRNRGHQNALLAGIATAAEHADMIVSMDADLQDDIDALERMIDAYHAGNDVVYGVRSSREKDTFFKRNSAQLYYRIMKSLGAEIVYNHADYRLLSKRAAEALLSFDEVNLFLRGIVPMVGFPSTTVTYERGERFAGKSKYPLGKMLTFALEGLTSLSVKPIRVITASGMLICLVSLAMFVKAIVDYVNGNVEPGWTSLIISIWALGGLQLFSIGIIGEYIGKTYLETKHRPRFIIESVLLNQNTEAAEAKEQGKAGCGE